MVGVDDGRDARTGIPVTSLYGETFESLTPTAAELEGLDVLVVDLQDVGSRYYTYVWTMALALGAAARSRRGGRRARPAQSARRRRDRGRHGAGRGATSFVGLGAVPGPPRPDDRRDGAAGGGRDAVGRGALRAAARLRPGRGRGARLAARHDVRGHRAALGDAVAEHADARHRAGLSGAVPVRGDELSEGRGTTRPFEIVGAPFLDGHAWAAALAEAQPAGRAAAADRRSARRFTSSPASRAAACSCTSPTRRRSVPTGPASR